MIPLKLEEGDGVRVIAPARSLSLPWITKEIQEIAIKRFEQIGLNLSFAKHVHEIDEFSSSSIKSRVTDLHETFSDPTVKLVITVIGGFNSNEILPYLDYGLIKGNPKILCGYSDITALESAIYAKTGLVTYSGPHFFDFGDKKGFDYTLEYFRKCLFVDEPFKITPSKLWSPDIWGKDQENRNFVKNEGFYVLNEGKASGTIMGSNLVTFHGLLGTPYIPSFKDTILFVEEDSEEHLFSFNRNLTSLTLNPNFSGVKGIVIGRFQPESKIGRTELMQVIKNNERLQRIPIIGGVNFGHTTPRITFPIGGTARVTAEDKDASLEIVEH